MKQMLPLFAAPYGRPPPSRPKMTLSLQHAMILQSAPSHLLQTEAVALPTTTKPPGALSQTGTSAQPRRVVDRAVQVQIVEDLPRVQQLLRQLVEQPGRFEVTGIDDTEHEAFQRSQSQPPDALVVDLNLRQGSGLGLIHAVRKLYGASPTGPLIIVVTNHTMPVLEAACIKAGADHFLDKSRELPRLAALLNQAFFP
jgi:CheY-like chemotaxis protein